MSSPTVSAYFVINMLEGARAQGYDLTKILADNQIPSDVLRNTKSRITFVQLSRLSVYLMELMNDECYGLLQRPFQKNTFRLMLYAVIHAQSIGQAMVIWSDFLNILDCGLRSSVRREETQTTFILTRLSGDSIKSNYVIEYFMLVAHRTFCWLAGTQIPILHAELDYPKPSYSSEYRQLFHGAPTNFSQQHCSMSFSDSSARLESLRDAKQLKDLLRFLPFTLLTQTAELSHLSAQIRGWLERQLIQHQRAPDIDVATERFSMHPQAMRRTLKKEGTSYKKIKMETRRDLAIDRIQRSELSVEDISYSLDFSEPSAFIRAFKSWTGKTPLAYRKLGSS